MLALPKVCFKGGDNMKIVLTINYRYNLSVYYVYSSNMLL